MLSSLKDHPALAHLRPPQPGSVVMSGLVILTMASAGMVTWLLASPETTHATSTAVTVTVDVDAPDTPLATPETVTSEAQRLPAVRTSAREQEVVLTPLPSTGEIGSLAGTVVDRHGKPVAGALVRLEDALDQPSVETSPHGSFHIAKVSHASAIVLIIHPSYVPTRRRLSTADSGLQDLRLVLWRRPTLRAHGRVAGGSPSFKRSGISVRLKRIVTQRDGRRLMAADSWLACTDEDGTYTVSALLPGRYLVEARVPRSSLQTAGFILTEEEVAAGGDIALPTLVFKPWASDGRANLASAR